jgi:hypothetical protein
VNPFLSGALRGFFVFLMVTAGLLVFMENPFATVTPFSYIRLAGLLSAISFYVTYDPRLFGYLLSLAGRRLTDGSEGHAAGTS